MKSGAKISELMERNGNMTQEALGKALGVSHVTIGKWEKNNPFPKGDNFDKLCEYFKVEASFFEVEEPEVKDVSFELIEEIKATLEFLKDQISTLTKEKAEANEEKAELRALLRLALSGNSPKPEDNSALGPDDQVRELWPVILMAANE